MNKKENPNNNGILYLPFYSSVNGPQIEEEPIPLEYSFTLVDGFCNVFDEDGYFIERGFLNKDAAKEWLKVYCKNMYESYIKKIETL